MPFLIAASFAVGYFLTNLIFGVFRLMAAYPLPYLGLIVVSFLWLAIVGDPVAEGHRYPITGLLGQGELVVNARIGTPYHCEEFYTAEDYDSGKTACYFNDHSRVIYRNDRAIEIKSVAFDKVPYSASPAFYAQIGERLGFDASHPIAADMDKIVWSLDGGTLTVTSDQKLLVNGITLAAS